MVNIKKDFYSVSIFIVSLISTLSSLYFSDVVGYPPCSLCWYQRICMYPIVIISLVGIIRKDINYSYYVLPLSLVGFIIASYHVFIQTFKSVGDSVVCSSGIPCSIKYINVFGFMDIPMFSLIAFFLIIVLVLLQLKFKK